jgi:hypothetical protein
VSDEIDLLDDVALRDIIRTMREDRVVLERSLAYVTNERDTMLREADSARLGLATTEEMIRELICRFKVDQTFSSVERALVLAEMLGGMGAPDREYATVPRG